VRHQVESAIAHLWQRPWAIRKPLEVRDIEKPLAGQLPAKLVQDCESADTRIEYADGTWITHCSENNRAI